jgi:PKD repeat protein
MNPFAKHWKIPVALAVCIGILAFVPCADAASSDSVTITGYILPSAAPVAAFSAAPLSGTAPLAVTFTDLSTNAPMSWNWAYRNATAGWTQFATVQNPSFVFYAPGTYDISLTAANSAGSDGEIRAGLITVTAPDPAARIAALRVYVSSLPIMEWAKWYLDVPLRNAEKHIEKDNKFAAINQMRSFADNVGTLGWLGIISPADAEYMTAEAAAISALIMA